MAISSVAYWYYYQFGKSDNLIDDCNCQINVCVHLRNSAVVDNWLCNNDRRFDLSPWQIFVWLMWYSGSIYVSVCLNIVLIKSKYKQFILSQPIIRSRIFCGPWQKFNLIEERHYEEATKLDVSYLCTIHFFTLRIKPQGVFSTKYF